MVVVTMNKINKKKRNKTKKMPPLVRLSSSRVFGVSESLALLLEEIPPLPSTKTCRRIRFSPSCALYMHICVCVCARACVCVAAGRAEFAVFVDGAR